MAIRGYELEIAARDKAEDLRNFTLLDLTSAWADDSEWAAEELQTGG